MSDPASKDDPSAYAPKSIRALRPVRPEAAQDEFPKHGEHLSERETARLLRSLQPELLNYRPAPWRPGSLSILGGLLVAVAMGALIGIYFADGAVWRKVLGFPNESRLTVDSPPSQRPSTASNTAQPPKAVVPKGNPSVASAPLQQTNGPGSSTAPQAAPPTPPQANAALPDASSTSASPPVSQRAGAPAHVAANEAPGSGMAAVRGVTNTEVRFGISAPFTGAAKELGNQMKLGLETAFNLANDAGGIDGRLVKLVIADDGYEPTRTADTMKQLFDKQQVFGFVGNVGTPTAVVALPYALQRHALFFGAFTGADLLRRDPPDRYVFNYRASYAEETEAAVNYLVKMRHLQPSQIAVFAQHDAFGDAGFAGVAKAMRTLRGDDSGILRLDYERNTVDVDNAIATLRAHKAPIKAIVMVAAYRAAAKFIEKTRDLYPAMIYTNVSFVGSTALANELMLLGPRFANGVIVTQVVPAVDSYSTAILKYRNALAKYFPGEAADYVSLEGYVDGMLLLEGLKRAGQKLDTEGLVDALETVRNFDLGLGTPINFSQSEHQGSHKVWGTQLDDHGRYQLIDLQ